ncbi:MAG: bifunctional UDP-N-acetylglucosamine diphosphorylase/glucosamine-1-phosphate N-acetyltransferase GlmU [Dehalococcoidia bacterium]
MSEWAAVILAAGRGTRMESDLPKVLHRVCGVEMIRHVVNAVQEVSDGPVLVVVAPEANEVRQCLGDSVEYVEQAEARGTGHALLQAEEAFRDKASRLLVLNGDIPLILPATLSRLMDRHRKAEATVTLLTTDRIPSDGLGRIIRDKPLGQVVGVVEEAAADAAQLAITEVNGGVYGFQAEWLWPAIRELAISAVGEYYLTDLVKMAVGAGVVVESVDSEEGVEILGVNNRVQLAQVELAMRERILRKLMLGGVTIIDPASTYIDAGVTIGRDTTVYPNTTVGGRSQVGNRCYLGPGSMIYDSVMGDDCKVVASMLEEAHLESSIDVGPFSHLRPGAVVERDVHIGNYAEIKNSRLGRGTKMGHFSYLGDAQVGREVNIGAGTVTCNYDGVNKNQTVIEDNAFIGSDTMLVAPVRIGARSAIGAGSVVNKDIPPDSVAVGMPARVRRRVRGHR